MPEYTPLDSLKEVFWVATNLIDLARDMLEDDAHTADPILESAKGELMKAVGRHVPGFRYSEDSIIEATASGRVNALTYDDGTQVKIPLQSENGWLTQDYYPRRDGSRWAFEARLEYAAEEREAEAREYERQIAREVAP